MCKECENWELEALDQFVMRHKYLAEERLSMERLMIDRVDGWNELGDNEKVVIVMDRVCRDETVARVSEKSVEEVICIICCCPPPAMTGVALYRLSMREIILCVYRCVC